MIPSGIPTFADWLQLIGFIAVLCYMGYGQWLQREAAKQVKAELKVATDVTKDHLSTSAMMLNKVEATHDLVNGRMERFMALLDRQSAADLQEHRQVIESAMEKIVIDLRGEFAKRVAELEKIIANQKTTIEGPTIAPMTADQRIGEIIPP